MSLGLNKRHYFVSIFFLLLLALPLSASALTIDSDYYGVGGIGVYFDINRDGDVADSGESFQTGSSMFQVNYNNYNTWGFCIDLSNAVGFGENDIDGTIEITGNYLYVNWLIDTYGGDLFAQANSGTDINLAAAALGLAIWEVLYDDYGSWDSNYTTAQGTGVFSYMRDQVGSANNGYYSDINDKYDEYIDQLSSAVSNTASWANWESEGEYSVLKLSQANGADDTQDIIVKVVPEPSTALLLGFGLLGLCGVGRKRV